MTTMTPVRVNVGDTVTVELPYSEVCMHMHIAGQVAQVELVSDRAAQIHIGGRPFSFPVLTGEAGLFHDAEGFYAYGELVVTVKYGDCDKCGARCATLHLDGDSWVCERHP